MAGKSSPFATGKDDDAATAREVDKLKQTARQEQEREEQENESEEDEFEVGGDDRRDEDDDDDEIEPEERPSRRERRAERGRSLVAAERERAERAEREAAEHRRLLHEALNRMPQQQQQPRPDPEKERLENEAESLRQQQEGLTARYAQLQRDKQLTPELDEKMRREAWALRDKIAANDIARFAPRQQQPQQQMTEQQVIAAANRARLMQEHADVVGNPRAAAAFRAEWTKLLHVRNEPDTWATLEKAMDLARREVGLPPKGGRPAPTSGAKRKYSGVSRGGGGGAEGRTTVTMTKELKEMADAAYPHIKDAKKRYQHFVNRNGEKFAKRA